MAMNNSLPIYNTLLTKGRLSTLDTMQKIGVWKLVVI